MTDLISLAKGKLNDPILMEWALRHYQDAQAGTPQRREAMEQDWFDDLTLRRWLDSDDQAMLARLFSELPADRFANLGPSIGARWGQWGGNLACAAGLEGQVLQSSISGLTKGWGQGTSSTLHLARRSRNQKTAVPKKLPRRKPAARR